MKNVKFLGDPRDNRSGPKELEWKGYVFPKDEEVSVDDAIAAKLATNDHFWVVGEPEPEEVEDPVVVHTVDECRAILDDRKVKYSKAATLGVLEALVEANGGFPESEGTE